MYAVIETGGKQYKVQEGSTLAVERLRADLGAAVTLDKVLVVADDRRIGNRPLNSIILLVRPMRTEKQ